MITVSIMEFDPDEDAPINHSGSASCANALTSADTLRLCLQAMAALGYHRDSINDAIDELYEELIEMDNAKARVNEYRTKD